MSIKIRPARASDISTLQSLAALVLNALHDDNQQVERLLQRVYSADSLRRTIENEAIHLLVAEVGGAIVGLCQFGSPLMDECEDRKEIHKMYVHPEHRYDAVAVPLITAVEATLSTDVDVRRVSIYVPENQITTIKFYARQGFHHERVEDQDGMWYMEKDL